MERAKFWPSRHLKATTETLERPHLHWSQFPKREATKWSFHLNFFLAQGIEFHCNPMLRGIPGHTDTHRNAGEAHHTFIR